MAALRALCVLGALALIVPVAAAEAPQVTLQPGALPQGPVRSQWCDGNATNSALNCVARVLGATPVAGEPIGPVAYSAASAADSACHTSGITVRACAGINALFFGYVHESVDLVTEKPFLLAGCALKYGLRCLVQPEIPALCPSPAINQCLPL